MDAEGVKLLGPVTFVRSDATRVARADYTGTWPSSTWPATHPRPGP